jgi:hypothetical protein
MSAAAGLAPHPKVISATSVAALVTVACWIASLRGMNTPPEVQGAITTVLVGAAAYLTPSPSA